MNSFIYSHVVNELTETCLMVFDTMAESIMPEDSNGAFEVNKWYRAADLKKILNMPIPSATLTALVRHGLLEDDRDKQGKLYCITDEMYDLLESVYWPSKDKYMSGLGGNWG